ncbi:hypothetical protein C2G38_2092905 [Gigaspora rosea]|uniref:C3H1-type domain-containing protein n=1 Tax=Gigaspora rosea TaxID=44941 RepID=A0A397V100_9GLOM|nr:hypothetical protein C2G38_2092905 [Gigaspora rosea]
MKARSEAQGNDKQESDGLIKYKMTTRKFPAIDNMAFKQLPVSQGLNNPKAKETERIRAWWVMNWTEGQKLIEMLPCKPSLTNRVWKALVFGSFINLQEFAYKNMVDNVKYMEEDTVLQTADNGVISVKKCPRNNTFQNISEWLLAFKSYMDAVLILYENCEQELNTYRDHINELCIKYEFLAVLGYDENRRIALVMNRDSTLLERNIEVEGKNFDATTAKRPKYEWRRANWADISWYDGKEICINFNKKMCPDEKTCSRVHACIVCRKLGHNEKSCFRRNFKNKQISNEKRPAEK